ncbi:MAG: hypothetical protein R3B82_30470, partial [Sandaracinaceae bacterium]
MTRSDDPRYVLEVSEGLRAHGQREIAIGVRLREGEPPDPIRAQLRSFFDTVRTLASQGRVVEEGGLTELGASGFLEPRIRGIGYGAPQGGSREVPGDALVGVLLFEDEAAVARSTSVARILARLGESTREFPFPTLSDRDRPSVASPRDGESLLATVPRVSVPELSLVMENGTLVLSAGPGAGPKLANALTGRPADAGFALLTGRAPRANAVLVWRPGQSEPAAIAPPGSPGTSLSGAMLIVAPGQTSDRAQMHEDGFALLVRDETWPAIEAALIRGTAFELPSEGLGLRVEHLRPGQHLPAGGVRNPGEIVLLTPEEAIRSAIAVEDLSL